MPKLIDMKKTDKQLEDIKNGKFRIKQQGNRAVIAYYVPFEYINIIREKRENSHKRLQLI